MARFKVVHSDDSVLVQIKGNKANPEPSTAIIKFPGGFTEVTRCSDGSYWVHIQRILEDNEDIGDSAGFITESRIDYTPEAYSVKPEIPPIPEHSKIQHIAIKISSKPALKKLVKR